MNGSEKYGKRYILPPGQCLEWAGRDLPPKAPDWCAADLGAGEKALAESLGLEEKIEYFRMLVQTGFREIEAGAPGSDAGDLRFCSTLVKRNLIPEGVWLQVETQRADSVLRKTLEALAGVNSIISLSVPVSALRLKAVNLSAGEGLRYAAEAASCLKEQIGERGHFRPAFCLEGFTEADPVYALEVCRALLEAWQPSGEGEVLIRLPADTEQAPSHIYASQVEYLYKNLPFRDFVVLSLGMRNDRGCAVGDLELGMLAGAQRIEGTLFGNGERAGAADLITLAMNLFTRGIDPGLDLSHMGHLCEVYERLTGRTVYDRQPYSGRLAFTAFSEPEQAAVARALQSGKDETKWRIPFLTADPADLGRRYEGDSIRAKTLSDRNSVNHILKTYYGLSLPERMREEAEQTVRETSGKEPWELPHMQVYRIFEDHYITPKHTFQIENCSFREENGIVANVEIRHGDRVLTVTGNGNGRLDAVSNAIKSYFGVNYELSFYEEHSLTRGSSSKAVAYVGITNAGHRYFGAGIDNDIIKASIEALAAAVNQEEDMQSARFSRDRRMVEIMNYIQSNYLDVTLGTLSERFYLSKPYLSKYIREKAGMTFGEAVKNVRLKKAQALLKSSSMTVESISLSVGYQNVEHFNRLFKKAFHMTPVQYRNAR